MTNQTPYSLRARFNPLIRPYLVVYVGLILTMTVVLIPLAVVWFCGVGQWWARHYFDKLECDLGTTALRFRKGILFEVERTIPLENIQDVTFIEGPLLKQFHLSILKFETAGQSAGQAHAMQLIGVIDAHDLRTQILSRREDLKNSRSPQLTAAPPASDDTLLVLRSILERLNEIADHLRKKN